MARNHPSGDPEVNAEHIDKQRKGDKELAGHKPGPDPKHERERNETPGQGRPDAEEGVGTVQNQRR